MSEVIVLYGRADDDHSSRIPRVPEGATVLFAESGLHATSCHSADGMLMGETPAGSVVAILSGLTETPPKPA